MTQHIVSFLWNISSRDACALIGIGFIAAAGITWFIQIPGRIAGSLDNIADAIKRKD